MAFYDTLTGLPNRRLLTDRLSHSIFMSERNGYYCGIFFIDLDNFKNVNDTAGHHVGDKLLIDVAERIKSCVRDTDTVARLGGDEFVVCADSIGTSQEEAISNASKLGLKITECLRPSYFIDSRHFTCTPSIGISIYRGSRNSIETLMQQADIAMYEAKAHGKNGMCFFDPSIQQRAETKVSLENELRRAAACDEWEIYYQVQVDSEGKPIGAEALIRWIHPERGIIMPGDFIHLAEETGLILPIGYRVLSLACQQLFFWKQNPDTEHLTIAVNVSARQFRNPFFVEEVRELITNFDIAPGRLKLELTESLFLGNVEDAISKMTALKNLGVSFALDDFGTGYSSLSYLKRLPFDQIKIDQSFVRDLLDDPNDAAIAKTVIDLGKSLGVDVIAEGVECCNQKSFLANNGCHSFQGFLYGRPMPIHDFISALVKQPEIIDTNIA